MRRALIIIGIIVVLTGVVLGIALVASTEAYCDFMGGTYQDVSVQPQCFSDPTTGHQLCEENYVAPKYGCVKSED